jgi:hypothetical protein
MNAYIVYAWQTVNVDFGVGNTTHKVRTLINCARTGLSPYSLCTGILDLLSEAQTPSCGVRGPYTIEAVKSSSRTRSAERHYVSENTAS